MKIFVKCENCGFEYELFTSDKDIIPELKKCNCGAETKIEIDGKEVE